jgi:membrane protein DedA with SNARE-associated domain
MTLSGLLHDIFRYIGEIINSLGYFGIAAGMFIESACIPLPSEVVLPIAGYMVSDLRISLLGANIAVAIGSMLGSLLAYSVGYYGGRPFILKYGKYFFVSADHFYKAEAVFNNYGVAAVFFGRLMPVIRTFISLPAGIARMNLKKFLVFSLVGMLPWNFLLIFLGYKLGPKFETDILPWFEDFKYLVIAAIILIILFFTYRYIKNRKKTH